MTKSRRGRPAHGRLRVARSVDERGERRRLADLTEGEYRCPANVSLRILGDGDKRVPPRGASPGARGHCRRAPDSRHVVRRSAATKRWDGLVGPQNAQGLGRRSTNIRDRVVQASDQSGEGLHRTEHAHGSAGRTPNDAILIVHQGGDGIDRSDVAEPSQSLTCRYRLSPRIRMVEEGAYTQYDHPRRRFGR